MLLNNYSHLRYMVQKPSTKLCKTEACQEKARKYATYCRIHLAEKRKEEKAKITKIKNTYLRRVRLRRISMSCAECGKKFKVEGITRVLMDLHILLPLCGKCSNKFGMSNYYRQYIQYRPPQKSGRSISRPKIRI